MSRTIRVGRYTVYRDKLEEVKLDLCLYQLRKLRLSILQAKYEDRDPEDYLSYRSPQVGQQPGAPEHVSNPTLNRVVGILETQELAYLEKWVDAVEMVMEGRLSDTQQHIVKEYIMLPPKKRRLLEEVGADVHIVRREAFYQMNEALLEFAFALIGENKVCTNHALQDRISVI